MTVDKQAILRLMWDAHQRGDYRAKNGSSVDCILSDAKHATDRKGRRIVPIELFAESVSIRPPPPPVMPRGYCDPHFVAVTSLVPRACPRQTAALNSWIDFGLTIHCVNTAAEIDTLRPLYPQVGRWHPSEDQATGFSKKTATINSLLDVSIRIDAPVLIINSDCETYGDPDCIVHEMAARTLVMGVRHNYAGYRHIQASREAWGIDAFVITPSMASDMPRLGFGIGVPVWDYWIPLHFQQAGFSIVAASDPWLYHKTHVLAWSQDDWAVGADIIHRHYGYPMADRSTDFRVSLPFPPVVSS